MGCLQVSLSISLAQVGQTLDAFGQSDACIHLFWPANHHNLPESRAGLGQKVMVRGHCGGFCERGCWLPMIKEILVNILFASQVSQCTWDVYKYPYPSLWPRWVRLWMHLVKVMLASICFGLLTITICLKAGQDLDKK